MCVYVALLASLPFPIYARSSLSLLIRDDPVQSWQMRGGGVLIFTPPTVPAPTLVFAPLQRPQSQPSLQLLTMTQIDPPPADRLCDI